MRRNGCGRVPGVACNARRPTGGVGSALVAMLALAVASPASAQQPPPATAPASAAPQWLTQCSSVAAGFDCRVSLMLVSQARQRIVQVVVRRPSKAEPPGLMLHLPHGLFLPAGVTMQIDKAKAETVAVQTCDDKGCYAGAPLPPATLGLMQKGGAINVTFQDLQKRAISVAVPLAGFAEAYQKLP